MPYKTKHKGQHIEDGVKNRLDYRKRTKRMMEMHEIKQKSILFRKKLLEDMVKTNYQNEYERLRGNLAHSVVPEQTIEVMRKRMDDLVKLGAKALPE